MRQARRGTRGAQRSHAGVPARAAAVVDAAEELVELRLAAVRDTSLSMSERLKAAADLENRGMGKPKETVEQVAEESEASRWLREMTPEQRRALMHQLYDEPEQDAAAGG